MAADGMFAMIDTQPRRRSSKQGGKEGTVCMLQRAGASIQRMPPGALDGTAAVGTDMASERGAANSRVQLPAYAALSKRVVVLSGHLWHAGVGVVRFPPALKLPWLQGLQSGPPAPGAHTANERRRQARIPWVQKACNDWFAPYMPTESTHVVLHFNPSLNSLIILTRHALSACAHDTCTPQAPSASSTCISACCCCCGLARTS